MEDTCRGETCWFYSLIKDLTQTKPDVKDCPFYLEMIWAPISVGQHTAEPAKVIKDCAQKRSAMMLLSDVLPRLTGVQKASEQARNANVNLVKTFVGTLNLMLKKKGGMNIELDERELIEDNGDERSGGHGNSSLS